MSEDSEDDYAEFGTALEPIDEDVCPRKKPFTIEEQVVRDKHGRRRFHGAFTGGFSAGFLNTVGSLEGWQPSSFKSSKSEKGASVVQKPEHFMDEEDMGEFGIAPSILHAKDDFSNNANKRKHSHLSTNTTFGESLFKTLLQPVRETIGIKLLRKMGWKPGQGIGPRVSKVEKKRISKMQKKVYGCSLPTDRDSESEDEEDEDDEELRNLTFAPHDYPFQLITPKENSFGIGYIGLDKRSILCAPQAKPEFQLRSKKSITGQAFGVGAFEEEDEDIYSREDMSQYDYSLTDNPGKDTTSGSKDFGSEDLYDLFALALKRSIKKIFPPPALPKDYKPIHKARVSRFEPAPVTPDQRKLTHSPDRKSSAEESEELQREARKLTQSADGISKGVFRPFVTDIDKQNRYDKYLKLVMAGRKDELGSLQPITMTEWEKERERIEFEQAAKLFKPLTGVMEDRFTVATMHDDVHNPLAVVERLRTGSDDEIKAAKMNMYGRLTRTIEDWKPASLLCKRFNIPELSVNEIPIVKNKPKYSIFDDIGSLKLGAEDKTEADEKEASPPAPEEKKNQQVAEPETEEFPNLPDPKNKIDLFNAIFLDTDSEEEESKEKVEESRRAETGTGRGREFDTPYEESITNDQRNTSPARGIFENLDTVILLPRTNDRYEREKHEEKVEAIEKGETRAECEINDQYGPKLPDKLVPVLYKPPVEVISDNDCWMEKTEHKKHKKKDKKSKKSKHKSKHKQKKSKR